jgi:hypothetical protein
LQVAFISDGKAKVNFSTLEITQLRSKCFTGELSISELSFARITWTITLFLFILRMLAVLADPAAFSLNNHLIFVNALAMFVALLVKCFSVHNAYWFDFISA